MKQDRNLTKKAELWSCCPFQKNQIISNDLPDLAFQKALIEWR